ncbi:hypothetical protein K440DRAFT_522692, partial [Wilcoxina mikolae CBS 423.85]
EAQGNIKLLQNDFKKRGHFDSIKKEVFAQFYGSDIMVQLRERLEDSTDSELTRDPSLMARDRGKAAAMIERSIDHRGVYKIAEDNFNELLDSRRDEVEDIIRELMLARGI